MGESRINIGKDLKIMSFDMATTTGWCFGKGDNLIYGSHTVPKSLAQVNNKLYHMSLWVGKILNKYKPEVLVIERPFARGHPTYWLMGICAIAEAMATGMQIDVIKFPPTTIKKFLTGNGKASKIDMLNKVSELGYKDVVDHNIADAIALHLYTQSRITIDHITLDI